ncbi:MAG: hypothetical protein QME14_03745 [Methanobacteriaceae archaeon]|nr:hypothetical protein [Methanobacteriaceae archaeon]
MILGWQTILPLQYDILIICIFDVVVIGIGSYLFSRRQLTS